MTKMRQRMNELGMSLYRLRQLTGINVQKLSRISQIGNPKYADAVKIAKALDTTPEALWNNE